MDEQVANFRSEIATLKEALADLGNKTVKYDERVGRGHRGQVSDDAGRRGEAVRLLASQDRTARSRQIGLRHLPSRSSALFSEHADGRCGRLELIPFELHLL